MIHKPVLQQEVLEYLQPKPNENFVDCTIGEGGHTAAILKKTKPKGKVLGIDQDSEQIKNCKLKIKERVILVCDSFTNLKKIIKENKFEPVQGILFDFGMSSWHLEKSGRGFSFLKNEPLDMRYNSENSLNAGEIINQWKEDKIEKILKEYSQERFSKRISEEIVKKRKVKPIETTFQLVEVIKKAIPSKYRYGRIHFATRTFQTLRIAVNQELENIKKALPQALEILEGGGRLVVISFHSDEDRIVKNFFRISEKKDPIALKILTKKPIRPTEREIKINLRSRSAKLRAAEKP